MRRPKQACSRFKWSCTALRKLNVVHCSHLINSIIHLSLHEIKNYNCARSTLIRSVVDLTSCVAAVVVVEN